MFLLLTFVGFLPFAIVPVPGALTFGSYVEKFEALVEMDGGSQGFECPKNWDAEGTVNIF